MTDRKEELRQAAERRRKEAVAPLEKWLAEAKPGDAIEYHRGHLYIDRMRTGDSLKRDVVERAGVVGDLMLGLSDDGLVLLTQKRHGPHDYSYLAAKVAEPKVFQSWYTRG